MTDKTPQVNTSNTANVAPNKPSPQKMEHVGAVADKIEQDNLLKGGSKTNVEAANNESANMSGDELVEKTKEEEGKKNMQAKGNSQSNSGETTSAEPIESEDNIDSTDTLGEKNMSDHKEGHTPNQPGQTPAQPGQSQPGKGKQTK